MKRPRRCAHRRNAEELRRPEDARRAPRSIHQRGDARSWHDEETARRLERDARELRRRFDRDFWVTGRRHFALALDGQKNRVDSLTSNIGHLLWSGIVDRPRAVGIVRTLLRDDMFSGWGIRSMSRAASRSSIPTR